MSAGREHNNVETAKQEDGLLQGVDEWLGSYEDHPTALSAAEPHSRSAASSKVKATRSAQLGAAAWESQYQTVHNPETNARFMQLAGSNDFMGGELKSLQQRKTKKNQQTLSDNKADMSSKSAVMQHAQHAAAQLLDTAEQETDQKHHAAKRELLHETDLLRMKLHSEVARRNNEESRAEGGGSFGWLWGH
jgi:hypothetical protein